MSIQVPKLRKYSLPYSTFLHKDKPYGKSNPAKDAKERVGIMRYAATLISATMDFLSAEATQQITYNKTSLCFIRFLPTQIIHCSLTDMLPIQGGREVWLQLQDCVNQDMRSDSETRSFCLHAELLPRSLEVTHAKPLNMSTVPLAFWRLYISKTNG